uniref:Uncharacterized protein n=1 Tax=Arundo donax TaxID=35708 RepID=A0A0A8XT56_ARUDO
MFCIFHELYYAFCHICMWCLNNCSEGPVLNLQFFVLTHQYMSMYSIGPFV